MTRAKSPDPDYVVLHIHRVDPPGPDLTVTLKRLERAVANVSDDIKKIRRALDKIKAAEAKEDADAAAALEERNTKVAELQAQIDELQARPTLSEEDHADLDALVAELEAMAPADEPVPDEPEQDPTAP
jgi:septal ring factor EnvC (AmiA/AmiB activator)